MMSHKFCNIIKNIKSKFVVLVFVCIFLSNINIANPLTAVVFETGGLGFVKQTLTEVSAFATKYATASTAANTLATWSKRLADFSIKKIAKTMAIDLVNRMSKCIEGTGPCKSPLYLKDPTAFMANIAASEIQVLTNAISADVSGFVGDSIGDARKALLKDTRNIQQNIGKYMQVLDQYNSDRLGIICSEDYVQRVGVVEGEKRKNMIISFCANAKTNGSYISQQDIQFVNYIYTTSKTPIKSTDAYLSVFASPNSYNPANVSQQILSASNQNIKQRQQDAKDAISRCGGYLPSTSPREVVTDKNGKELTLSEYTNTPCGTIEEQDTFARLQQARSWEKVDTVEDFFVMATDQLTQSLINRGAKEGLKIVNNVVVKVDKELNNINRDINNSINDFSTDLKCAANDSICNKRQADINDAINFNTENDLRNLREILAQREQKNSNSYSKVKKAVATKSYYKQKLENSITLSNSKITILQTAINYYNTVDLRFYTLVKQALDKDKIVIQNRIAYIESQKNIYQSRLDIVNKEIKSLQEAELELLNLVGDQDLYPNLQNKSVYRQCFDKINNKTIKNIISMKNVTISTGNSNYITENIPAYSSYKAIAYNCDVEAPVNKDYVNTENIAIKEEIDYAQRINYESVMKNPNSQSDVYNNLDDNFKVFHKINIYVDELSTDPVTNTHSNPESYVRSLINLYYPPSSGN